MPTWPSWSACTPSTPASARSRAASVGPSRSAPSSRPFSSERHGRVSRSEPSGRDSLPSGLEAVCVAAVMLAFYGWADDLVGRSELADMRSRSPWLRRDERVAAVAAADDDDRLAAVGVGLPR